MAEPACPCGSGEAFNACCGPYVEGLMVAPTALALMRARYTAYTLERLDFVRASWDPQTCPARLQPVPGQRWLGLKIKRVERGGAHDDSGVVEFVARCKRGGRAQRLHEVSYFVRSDGCWLYRHAINEATDDAPVG